MVNYDGTFADDEACRRILLEHEKEREDKLRDIAASLTQPRVRRNKPRNSEPTRDVVDAVHGVNQDKLVYQRRDLYIFNLFHSFFQIC